MENIIIDKRPPILFSLLDENDLVDNYDVNNEMEKEGQLFIIKSKKNRGFSAGNNLGLTFASQKRDCKYLWILNNDTIADKNSISSKIKYLEDQGDSILLGTKILDYYKPKNIQSYGGLINKYFATTKHFGKIWIGKQSSIRIILQIIYQEHQFFLKKKSFKNWFYARRLFYIMKMLTGP